MEEHEKNDGTFGSGPLEVIDGVAMMEESVELHVADLVTQFWGGKVWLYERIYLLSVFLWEEEINPLRGWIVSWREMKRCVFVVGK
jgi:hypothetical protein